MINLKTMMIVIMPMQGGPMSPAEVAKFEKNPHLKTILQVRIWDDLGKVKDKATPDFEYYAPMVEKVVQEFERTNG